MEDDNIIIRTDLVLTLSRVTTPAPDLMSFRNANNEVVGALKIEGDQLVFEGDADESAEKFFIVLKALIDAHLATYFGKV